MLWPPPRSDFFSHVCLETAAASGHEPCRAGHETRRAGVHYHTVSRARASDRRHTPVFCFSQVCSCSRPRAGVVLRTACVGRRVNARGGVREKESRCRARRGPIGVLHRATATGRCRRCALRTTLTCTPVVKLRKPKRSCCSKFAVKFSAAANKKPPTFWLVRAW
jgi:hypothetical protein